MTWISFVFFAAVFVLGGNAITLNNGGYEDIYIVIQDTVAENLELLDRIKDVFTKSSKFLFTATKNKVYFKSIKVIIPKSWSTQSFYKSAPAFSTLKTYIKIDGNSARGPGLDVKFRTYECGEEGMHMTISPEFLLNTGVTEWGKHENAIVHEWGHLRWGLFDEYPVTPDPVFILKDEQYIPNTCSTQIKGKVGHGPRCISTPICNTRDTRKRMPRSCNFCPETNQTLHTSLMGYQYINAMKMFCDMNDESVPVEQRHNDKADNMHNRICDYKSAWEVMREHPDFRSSTNSLPSDFNTEPEFTFIKETDMHRVFVLDISGSMDTNDRIGILHQTGEQIIQQDIKLDSWLGIIWFSDSASLQGKMTRVEYQRDRDYLKQQLPTTATGGTCIGCGIEEGIKVLKEALGTAENGEIILITDGKDGGLKTASSRATAIREKVVIHTIAVSQQADTTLAEVAAETGGKHFTYLERESVSFTSVFAAAISDGGVTSAARQSVTVMSETSTESSAAFNVEFSLDEGLGKDTSVTILVNKDDTIEMQLEGPNNYTQSVTNIGTSATLNIPDIAEAGDYMVEIKLQTTQTIEYYIKSYPSSSNSSVIRMSSRLVSSNVDMASGALPVVLVDVTKGHAPVLNATVQALVDSGKQCTIDLHDNGVDPDIIKNDGTYAGYILSHCLNSGRVNIKVYASGNKGETFMLYGRSGAASPYSGVTETEVNEDVFQRVDITEELFITNYVENTEDVTGPGRITDVSINNIETKVTPFGESRNFTITWTATGDDKNIGKALYYEMKVSSDFYSLVNNFDMADHLNMTNVTIIPQAAGAVEALKIAVDAEEVFAESMYFAVRAVDENRNFGPVSNIVSILVANGFRISGDKGHAIDEDDIPDKEEDENNAGENDDISMKKMEEKGSDAQIIIIILVVLVVFILIIAGLIFYFRRRAARKANYPIETITIADATAASEEEPRASDTLLTAPRDVKVNMEVSTERLKYIDDDSRETP